MKRYEKNLLPALAMALGATLTGVASGPSPELHGHLLRYLDGARCCGDRPQ